MVGKRNAGVGQLPGGTTLELTLGRYCSGVLWTWL